MVRMDHSWDYMVIGATAAEKLDWGITWGGCRSPFFFPFPRHSLPSLLGLLSHPRFTHPLPYSSLLLCLSLARRSVLLSTLPIVDDLRDLRSTNTNRLVVQFCSLAVLDPRVGHTMDVQCPFISVLCHSDGHFHGEFCPRLDVVHVVPPVKLSTVGSRVFAVAAPRIWNTHC